jgi:hypothetical protein
MEENTVQKKVEMIGKIFAQTRDEKLRRSLLEEVVSSRVEPIKVRPSNVNPFPKKRFDITKTGRPVSKIRKLIFGLLLPVEIMCEIIVNRPWLALFTIFGVILFIGKFISPKVAMGMAFSMLFIFILTERGDKSHIDHFDYLKDDNSSFPLDPGSPYRKFYFTSE